MDDSVDLSAGHQERGKEAEKYKKVRVLGEGSMGRAYLVECTDNSRLYVMKRINIGHLGPK
jgi:serine/threonine protein kinase